MTAGDRIKTETQSAKTENRSWLSRRDVVELPKLAFLACCAWVLPERCWPRLCRTCAVFRTWLLPRRTSVIRAKMTTVFGPGFLSREPALDNLAGFYYERLCLLRSYRPDGWRPTIVLEGREHIDAALAKGQGVILLASFFTFNSLVTKMALAQAGIAGHQLSRPEHGFSSTRFGRRVLNPVMTTVENRYIASRITMPTDGTAAAMRHIRKLLDQNLIVIVTAGVEARRTMLVPIAGGCMRLAPGPYGLSLSSGAALLPVFTIRENSGMFRCVVGDPLTTPEAESKADAISHKAAAYAAVLEGYVRRYPGQWRHWYHVEPSEVMAVAASEQA